MRRYRLFIFAAASVALLSTNLFPKSRGIDSTLTPELIESTIVFLKDPQKVAELTRQLQLLAEAQRAAGTLTDDTSQIPTPQSGANIFKAVKKAADGWSSGLSETAAEMENLIGRIKQFSSVLRGRFLLEWALSLLLMLLLAVVIGGVVAFSLWRTGRRMWSSFIAGPAGSKRVQGVFSVVLTRCAFGAGGALTLFIISLFPWALQMQRFFSSSAAGYAVYIVAVTLLAVLFSPNVPGLRFIPCCDKAAYRISGRLRTILRVSLLMYLLYQMAAALEMAITCRFIILAFQILMTVMLPDALYRLRPWYLDAFRKFHAGREKIGLLTQIADFVLSRLYLIAFLYGVALLWVAMAATPATYKYFIHGTTATLMVLLAGGIIAGLWHGAVRQLSGSSVAFVARYPELHARICANIRIINTAGYVLIASFVLFFLIRMWGVQAENLLKSRSPAIQVSLRVAAIGVGVWICMQAASFVVSRFQRTAQSRMSVTSGANVVEIEKRISTLGDIFRKIITLSLIAVGAIMILDELGFDVKAMVAGLGIAGIAVGFGAQNLVRDVISGLFLIFENRIRVGDVAVVNGTAGLVENVNLRTTVLRGVDGTIHVFPNGAISTLSNMTHEFSYYVFTVGVAYKEDPDRVLHALKQLGEEIGNDPEYRDSILEPLEIMGVDAFADSAVIIKARIKTVPARQWLVGREMNRRIKKRFDELGIEIPFPHRTIYYGNAAKPFPQQTGDALLQREELKKLLVELLEEQRRKDLRQGRQD